MCIRDRNRGGDRRESCQALRDHGRGVEGNKEMPQDFRGRCGRRVEERGDKGVCWERFQRRGLSRLKLVGCADTH